LQVLILQGFVWTYGFIVVQPAEVKQRPFSMRRKSNDRSDLSDDPWALIEALLPPQG